MSRSVFTQVCCTVSCVMYCCCPFHPPRHCAIYVNFSILQFCWQFYNTRNKQFYSKKCTTCGQPNRTAPHAFHFNAQVLPLYKPQHVFETGTTTSGWIKPRLTPVPTHLFIWVPFCGKRYSLANTRANTNYINNGRQKKSLQRYRFAFAQISITFHNLGTALVRNIVATFFKSIELLYLSLLQYPASNHNKDLHHHHRLQAIAVLSNR